MKLGIRATLMLTGAVLLYLGLVSRTSPSPLTVLVVLLTGILVFAAGWRLASRTTSLAGGMAAVVFFLLNPAVIHLGLTSNPSESPLSAFFAMAFLCTWLWMEHWSSFMRSLMLTLLYTLGLWTGAPAVFWIFYALILWVVFNRRPGPAVGMLVCVFVGGWFLYGITWMAMCFVFRHTGAVAQPLKDLLQQLRTFWPDGGALALSGDDVIKHWLGNLRVITLPWGLLSLWAAGERFYVMIRDRRADISSFAGAFVCVTAGVSLYEAACGGAPTTGLLAAWVAFSAPLVARECVQRELLFTRSARITAGIALGFTAAIVWIGGPRPTLWEPAAAMLLVFLCSSAFVGLRRLARAARVRAILVGTLLVCYGSAGYLLWRG